MMRHLVHASLLCLVLTPSSYAADPVSDQDPDRDLSVSFSTKHDGGADPGYIFGTVTNSSNTAYPCVYVEFNLSTRFDMRQAGEESRQLGILGVEVKGVRPHSANDFKKDLSSPAGIGLKSVRLCEESPESQRRNERVPAKRGTPPADTGDNSSDQTTVRDHRTQVRDHRTGSAKTEAPPADPGKNESGELDSHSRQIEQMREEQEMLERELRELDGPPPRNVPDAPRRSAAAPSGEARSLTQPPERLGVTLYESSDYEGRSETFFEDDPRLSDNRIGNDRASSIRVPEGCLVTLYKDSDYRGQSAEVTTDSPDLRRTSVGNDAVSSLKIRCE